MIKLIIGFAVGVGLTIFTQAATTPCMFEDGPAPCHWNADTRGNGEGESFLLLTERIQIPLP